MKGAAFFSNHPGAVDHVYGSGRRESLAQRVRLHPETVTQAGFRSRRDDLAGIEVVFSTWGMWPLAPDELDALPRLQAVFYAAGSVKGFAGPLLDRGIVLVSGWAANAVPVAEFVLAQILLSCKGYFRNAPAAKNPELRREGRCFRGRGAYGETVAIIGAGRIGRTLIALLKPFALKTIVHDPRLTEREARDLGVEKVCLEDAFRRGYVVTNHAADLPSTRGMLHAGLFAAMRRDATFINTGRGAQVIEPDLVRVLEDRPDLTALLDVTDPEPPAEDSPLYRLPNTRLSSHIAGSIGDEVLRMADTILEEFDRWERGDPLRFRVTPDMLAWMA